MDKTLGKTIKSLRKDKGMTQQQLAAGICTQALISMFESDETIPSSIVMYKIAQKLEVDMNYFFPTAKPSEQIYAKGNELFTVVRKLVHNHEYHAAHVIINNELEKTANTLAYDLSFLYWHKGICTWELEKNREEAFRLYALALEHAKNNEELIVSIKNSMAIIHFNEQEYDEALTLYEQCLPYFDNQSVEKGILYRKIMIGLSRTYSYAERFNEALVAVEQAIATNIKEESLYLLGELLFQKGRIYMQTDEENLAIKAFSQAKVLFQLDGNYDYEKICDRNIEGVLTVK
jgi:transcriptional regulator with XRE-family HTH domain